MEISEVANAPQLLRNLLSVRQITAANDCAVVLDKNEGALVRGTMKLPRSDILATDIQRTGHLCIERTNTIGEARRTQFELETGANFIIISTTQKGACAPTRQGKSREDRTAGNYTSTAAQGRCESPEKIGRTQITAENDEGTIPQHLQ